MRWDARLYDRVENAPQEDAGRLLVEMAGARATDSILDLGCGTGKITLELASLAHRGGVVGIDPSKEMLEIARQRAGTAGNVRFIRAAAQEMDFSGEFDLVFSNSAFQWVKEQEDALGRVYESLRNGGRIAFQLPQRDFCGEFFEYISDAASITGLDGFFDGWESPWCFHSKEEYEAMLKDTGFRDIRVLRKEYALLFESVNEVLGWWASAGLRPFLEALPEREREYFSYAFAMGFEKNRTGKGIEFGFRRLFIQARK